jgi:hypothetical protein
VVAATGQPVAVASAPSSTFSCLTTTLLDLAQAVSFGVCFWARSGQPLRLLPCVFLGAVGATASALSSFMANKGGFFSRLTRFADLMPSGSGSPALRCGRATLPVVRSRRLAAVVPGPGQVSQTALSSTTDWKNKVYMMGELTVEFFPVSPSVAKRLRKSQTIRPKTCNATALRTETRPPHTGTATKTERHPSRPPCSRKFLRGHVSLLEAD